MNTYEAYLEEKALNKSDEDIGLFHKYIVERVDGKPLKGGGCIVLEFGDPNARVGIKAYADHVRSKGYVPLADDLDNWLDTFED